MAVCLRCPEALYFLPVGFEDPADIELGTLCRHSRHNLLKPHQPVFLCRAARAKLSPDDLTDGVPSRRRQREGKSLVALLGLQSQNTPFQNGPGLCGGQVLGY
ncbi:Kinesin-Like Protein Kif2B [Manis pentadactyla]|nr:Kinesin-Like Protein Kif2B [Manis pentadactyla]